MAFILVKPETLLLCKESLVEFLEQNKFCVERVIPLACWDDLSIRLYNYSEKVTKEQLILQNIARRQIMGEASNKIEIWELKYITEISEKKQQEILTSLKYQFRKMQWQDGLTLHIEYNDKSSVFHFTYFHVSDSNIEVIKRERDLFERYINECNGI